MPNYLVINEKKQRQFYEATHTQTINDFLDSIKARHNDIVVDGNGVCWKVGILKKGFDLTAVNCYAYIPYWACLKIQLPDLRRANKDEVGYPAQRLSNSLRTIMKLSGVEDGYHYRDKFDILWRARQVEVKPDPRSKGEVEDEFDLQAAFDNACLDWNSLQWISFPGFELISTPEQRKSPEFIKNKHTIYG